MKANPSPPSKRVTPHFPTTDQTPSLVVTSIRTLVIDIGGSGIKALIVNENGEPVGDRLRMPTPKRSTPQQMMRIIKLLAKKAGRFHRVSVGFPGIVRNGVVSGAVNLDPAWEHFHLTKALHKLFRKKPVRAANDADIQGFGAISGKGVELVLTLGTGVGSSLFVDGTLVPNVEVGKNRLRKSELERVGKKVWNNRLVKVVAKLEKMFHYDRLYIGGGNAAQTDISRFAGNVSIVSNIAGLHGGIALWRDGSDPSGTGNG